MFQFKAIGTLQSCFKEKFGIPRQSGLAAKAPGIIKLGSDPDYKTALKYMEGFSHLWVIFVFHEHDSKRWKPSIRPPRLGGAKKVGVLASRSPHRPNPIGMSAVKIEKIDLEAKGGPEIHVSGVDILDGTPILDLKPYVPYADSIPEATSGWAGEPIARAEVLFTEDALSKVPQGMKSLIEELVALDPRPASQRRKLPRANPENEGLKFGFAIQDLDVHFKIRGGGFEVIDVIRLEDGVRKVK